MRGLLEVLALGVGFAGWALVGVALQDKHWRESTTDGSVITTSSIYANLWMSCASDSTGIYDCYDFQSMLALPGYIQVCRACMIGAVVLGCVAMVCTLLGMQCSKVAGDNPTLKTGALILAGVAFLLQGVSTMIAVSWYAFNITQEFFNDQYPGIKYELGNGLYIGWSSALLALCTGILLLVASKLGSFETRREAPARQYLRYQKTTTSVSYSTCDQYRKNEYV